MKKYIPYLVILVLAVCLLLSAQTCSYYKGQGDANGAALTDTVQYFKNALGRQTASIKTLQVNKAGLKNLLLNRDKELAAAAAEFAKVSTVVKIEQRVKIDTVFVAYNEPAPCDFERSGRVSESWYGFSYTSTQNGFKIDSLQIPNSINVVTGIKRKWFLGKESLVTDVSNTNPYITVTSLKAAEITVPVPWYKKWYVWAAAGFVGGVFLVK